MYNKPLIQLGLLIFGEKGMELVAVSGNKQTNALDNSYVNLMGNHYANVLQMKQDPTAKLYGPFPILHRERNDMLLLILGFKARDPNIKDIRVVKNNYMVDAQILVFYPANYDIAVSLKREVIEQLLVEFIHAHINTYIKDITSDNLSMVQVKFLSILEDGMSAYSESTSQTKIIQKNISLIHDMCMFTKKAITCTLLIDQYSIKKYIIDTIFTADSTVVPLVKFSPKYNTMIFSDFLKLNICSISDSSGIPLNNSDAIMLILTLDDSNESLFKEQITLLKKTNPSITLSFVITDKRENKGKYPSLTNLDRTIFISNIGETALLSDAFTAYFEKITSLLTKK